MAKTEEFLRLTIQDSLVGLERRSAHTLGRKDEQVREVSQRFTFLIVLIRVRWSQAVLIEHRMKGLWSLSAEQCGDREGADSRVVSRGGSNTTGCFSMIFSKPSNPVGGRGGVVRNASGNSRGAGR